MLELVGCSLLGSVGTGDQSKIESRRASTFGKEPFHT
jgi:hypothetical protein